jgi:thiamine pyrophosphate-dependent acetolactate synthase large subunit-like protein
LGWGAAHASDLSVRLAEALQAPVATTLQGLSVFPGNLPLHVGMGIGSAAVPAAEHAFEHCDVLLAEGTRFGEIATGSFGLKPSWQLIHVDINLVVFNANYPAHLCLEGDARALILGLLDALVSLSVTDAPAQGQTQARGEAMRARIARLTPGGVSVAAFDETIPCTAMRVHHRNDYGTSLQIQPRIARDLGSELVRDVTTRTPTLTRSLSRLRRSQRKGDP